MHIMTKGEINLLYVEVEKLLNEICSFLKEEISGGYISQNGRSLADKLIEKSKKQLQTISILTTADPSDCTSEPYVDMKNYKISQNSEEEPQELYSDISLYEVEVATTPVNEEYVTCPYANLPATELKEGKMGQLYKKEKFFFIGQQKKVFAAVQQAWFLVYMNEHSVKPCQTFDLTRYEAKPTSLPLKDLKKREESFDLTSFIDSKTYHFTALTAKDMLQWVGAINKQSVSNRELPPVPTSPKISDKSLSGSTESMNDYEPLTEYQLKQKKIKEESPIIEKQKIKEKPSVPPRNTPVKTIQRPTLRIQSEESLSSNYDDVGPPIIEPSQSSSFSDDDSDTFYDNPTELKKEKTLVPDINTNNGNSNNDLSFKYDEDNIYDYLENPNTVPKQPNPTDSLNNIRQAINQHSKEKKQNENVPAKSKPSLKPKMLSLRRKRKDNT